MPIDDTTTRSDAEAAVDTSIVVCTCSRVHLLRGAIQSLLAQTWARRCPVEMVVVDDGSTDETAAYLASVAADAPFPIRIVAGPRKGIAEARNTGFFAARGRWIASFDDDQLADPKWLSALRRRADREDAACVGGALSLVLPPGVKLATLGARVRSVLGEHHPFPAAQPYTGAFHPATNNALLRRDAFLACRGFDPAFTEGGEDKELFRRMEAAGHSVWFEPGAKAGHITPLSRLEERNLRWTALRLGASDARFHLLAGKRRATGRAAVRTLSAPLRDLPLLLLLRRRSHRTNTLCSLWYTLGLLRAHAALAFPGQSGDSFLNSLNFRNRNGERPEAVGV